MGATIDTAENERETRHRHATICRLFLSSPSPARLSSWVYAGSLLLQLPLCVCRIVCASAVLSSFHSPSRSSFARFLLLSASPPSLVPLARCRRVLAGLARSVT